MTEWKAGLNLNLGDIAGTIAPYLGGNGATWKTIANAVELGFEAYSNGYNYRTSNGNNPYVAVYGDTYSGGYGYGGGGSGYSGGANTYNITDVSGNGNSVAVSNGYGSVATAGAVVTGDNNYVPQVVRAETNVAAASGYYPVANYGSYSLTPQRQQWINPVTTPVYTQPSYGYSQCRPVWCCCYGLSNSGYSGYGSGGYGNGSGNTIYNYGSIGNVGGSGGYAYNSDYGYGGYGYGSSYGYGSPNYYG